MSPVDKIKSKINVDSPRSLDFLVSLVSPYKDEIIKMPQGMKRYSMVVDAAIWYLSGDGWVGSLPFTLREAYFALGIPKEI